MRPPLTDRDRNIVFGALLGLLGFFAGTATVAAINGRHDFQLSGLFRWATQDPAGLFTICLFGVGCVQAWLFFQQLGYMRQSLTDATNTAKSALESARIARSSLIASNRGWIKTHIEPNVRAIIVGDRLSLSFTTYVSNVGNTPVTGVYTDVAWFSDSEKDHDFIAWIQRRSRQVRGFEDYPGVTLFPNDSYPEKDERVKITRSINIRIDEFKDGIEFQRRIFKQQGFVLRILFCTNYSFTTDNVKHQTRKFFSLNGTKGSIISIEEIASSGIHGVMLHTVNPFRYGDHAD